jgi:amidase
MAVKPPNIKELESIAERYHFPMPLETLEQFRAIIEPLMSSYDRLDEMTEPTLTTKYPDRRNWKPSAAENPVGGWYWRSEIKGAAEGPLKGRTFAIKDNVCVAGVPMMNGTKVLEGYTPQVDATIVTRILDAGGTILGKALCESFCYSGNSHTSESGIARNPYDMTRSPGGSSTGSAALVANCEVDMSIGCDQAGSIRIPSSWSGIYGLKPTYGLVPYSGVGPMEHTIDHTGPMARSVADVAAFLEVIAGPDGLDPRQYEAPAPSKYTAALTGDIKGLRVGVMKEGFGLPSSQKDVDDAVREQAGALAKLGATVSEVSMPLHRDGFHIWAAIGFEGVLAYMIDGFGFGKNWKGYYPTDLIETLGKAYRDKAQMLPPTVKMSILLGRYSTDAFNGRYYARARNLSRTLKAGYDALFDKYDILVWPTTPMKAQVIPGPDAPLERKVMAAVEMIPNTCPLNVTGHPALNVPCAISEGLPVGMMFVGPTGGDATILRAADAYQRGIYSPPPAPRRT